MEEIVKNDAKNLLKEVGYEEDNQEKEKIEIREEITTLKQLEKVIKDYFPSIWFETKACLSAYCSLSLESLNGCPSLILVGNPSGEKTTIISWFYNNTLSYLSDDFTPKSFVTHSANVKKENLEEIDLLPKIKNKALLTPELAPLFECSKDKLIDNFSMLTRVLDGEGLNRDSGIHGHRGYTGDYKFVWIGATTPLRAHVWNMMGKIGNRLFFLNMLNKNRTNEDYIEMFMGKEYEEKLKICRRAINSFLRNHFKKYPVRNFKWENKKEDIPFLKEIIKYAQLLSKLRGSLMTWKSQEERGNIEYSFPIIEEPPRAINSLRNFARGNALINERNYFNSEDLFLVKQIVLSSMPHDRYKFLELLRKHNGRLTTKTIEKGLGCSQDTALRTMKSFEVLGIVEIKDLTIEINSTGRPMKIVEIKEEFKELLKHTQPINDEINNKSQEMNPVYEEIDFSQLKIKEDLEDG